MEVFIALWMFSVKFSRILNRGGALCAHYYHTVGCETTKPERYQLLCSGQRDTGEWRCSDRHSSKTLIQWQHLRRVLGQLGEKGLWSGWPTHPDIRVKLRLSGDYPGNPTNPWIRVAGRVWSQDWPTMGSDHLILLWCIKLDGIYDTVYLTFVYERSSNCTLQVSSTLNHLPYGTLLRQHFITPPCRV